MAVDLIGSLEGAARDLCRFAQSVTVDLIGSRARRALILSAPVRTGDLLAFTFQPVSVHSSVCHFLPPCHARAEPVDPSSLFCHLSIPSDRSTLLIQIARARLLAEISAGGAYELGIAPTLRKSPPVTCMDRGRPSC